MPYLIKGLGYIQEYSWTNFNFLIGSLDDICYSVYLVSCCMHACPEILTDERELGFTFYKWF
jgi:hypothetical protein